MLNIILIIFISFIPIVFWGYIFSSMQEKSLNKKRFIIGILAGVLSVLPILYMDKIIDFIKIKSLDFFELAKNISLFKDSFSFSFSLGLFLFLLVLISLFFSLFFKNKLIIIKNYFRNFLFVLLLVFTTGIIFYFLNILGSNFEILNYKISGGNIYFGDTIFNTIKLIIFYYILIAFIEESSKHFNFLGLSILSIKKVEDGVLYAIFVALGFSFIENILYFYNLYLENGFGFELTKTYFFRSVFSLMVHVFASSVVAYFFTKSYLEYKKNKKVFPYLKTFFIGLSIGIFLHFLFDFTLTLGFGFIIILYFVVGYLYVSSIFFKE